MELHVDLFVDELFAVFVVVLLDLVHIVVAYVPAGLIKMGLGNMLVYDVRFKTDMSHNGKSTLDKLLSVLLGFLTGTSLTGSLRLNVVAPSSAISTESVKSKL